MELKALSKAEAKRNLSEIYNDQFDEVIGKSLVGTEKLYFAADCSISNGEYSYIGFLVLTSTRLIKVTYRFNAYGYFGGRKVIHLEGGYRMLWFPRPLLPFTRGELQSRVVDDVALETYKEIQYSRFTLKKSRAKIIWFDKVHGAFSEEDGLRLYSLLLEAIRRGGRLDDDGIELVNHQEQQGFFLPS